jgi:hypothetical protein
MSYEEMDFTGMSLLTSYDAGLLMNVYARTWQNRIEYFDSIVSRITYGKKAK